MTTKQGRGVTQAVAFDAATVGGAWVGVWGSIGELGAHYMCEVRFGSVLRFQLGVQKVPLLPEMKIYYMHNVCTITPNPVLLVARNCAHYVQSDARGEILMSHYSA